MSIPLPPVLHALLSSLPNFTTVSRQPSFEPLAPQDTVDDGWVDVIIDENDLAASVSSKCLYRLFPLTHFFLFYFRAFLCFQVDVDFWLSLKIF